MLRRPEILRWWCAAAILVQAALWLTLVRSRAWLAPAFAGTLALWLPTGWGDVAWTMVPGAILAALVAVRWPLASPGTDQPVNGGQRPLPRRAAVMSAMAIAVALGGASRAWSLSAEAPTWQESAATGGDENGTAEDDSSRRPRTAVVYIPIDDDGNEVRDLVLVPRDFYDHLLRQTPQTRSSMPWLVESIRHTVEAEPNPFDNQSRLCLSSRFPHSYARTRRRMADTEARRFPDDSGRSDTNQWHDRPPLRLARSHAASSFDRAWFARHRRQRHRLFDRRRAGDRRRLAFWRLALMERFASMA
ncbi:MAG: hypothetical protein R3B96_21485 [Pirellulaceae bacterium]